jgi:hypothetical protein
MSSFFGSGPLPDWKEIREWIGKDLPWKLAENREKADNEDWLDRFVSSLLKEKADTDRPAAKSLVQSETVQQNKKVTVTVRIPQGTSMRDLRLFATSDKLRISGLPSGQSHFVRLPCLVYPRTGRAVQRDDRIVVTFRRRPSNREEVELFIGT